jgi:signal transduction histidine kinase
MGLGAEVIGQLDHLGDWGVLATDSHLAVTGWNRWLVQHTGWAPATVLGRTLFDLFPDLTARRVDRYYRQALAGHPVVLSQRLHQYVLPMPPGIVGTGLAHMQQSVRIIPIVDGPGAGGTITLIEDVTERVTHEAELRARARRQAGISAAARAALAGREPEDIARDVAGLVCEMLGVEFAEVLESLPTGSSWLLLAGCGWSRPVVSVFEGAAAHRAQAARSADAPVQAEDVTADPRLAGDSYLRAHGVAAGAILRVPGTGNQPVRLLGAYSRANRRFTPDEAEFLRALADVLGMAVDRKRLEGELQRRVRDLAEADRRKDEFLAMLAHELRNPLAPVRNGLQILRLAGTNPQVVAQTRDMIDRQVQHLARLVDDLMDVSRISRGRIELRKQPVDLAEVAGRAVEEARPLIESRKHRLTVAHRSGPARVSADPVRLTQVVANLLNNAAKYTDEGGEITLTVERDGEHAIVRVRDSGVGISPEMLSRVFELFTQVDSTLDRAQGGLGIGLTLVRSLVEMHGGLVEVSSEGVGRGSEFVVRLPAIADGQRSVPVESADDGPVVPRRVLVVDDNEDSADSLATLLQLGGHEVETAHNGLRALEAAGAFSPEVVLLDIGLPGMSGFEVARALRERRDTRDALIVAMTGYGQETDRERSRDAGFDFHLVKPLDPKDLRRLLSAGRSSAYR